MSTRSCIARVKADGFEGVYCHWDGYPSGNGAQLYYLYHNVFHRNLEVMLTELIDNHPGGWSTIFGNWNIPAGFREHGNYTCAICGRQDWEHYRQYYRPIKPEGPALPQWAPDITDTYLLTDHLPEETKQEEGPQCYCHGDRHEEGWVCTHENASNSGVEYVYAFARDYTERPIMNILSSYCEDGAKMIGMFGSGDPNANWKTIVQVYMDDEEPDWEAIEGREEE